MEVALNDLPALRVRPIMRVPGSGSGRTNAAWNRGHLSSGRPHAGSPHRGLKHLKPYGPVADILQKRSSGRLELTCMPQAAGDLFSGEQQSWCLNRPEPI
jgi:hypothetical protein